MQNWWIKEGELRRPSHCYSHPLLLCLSAHHQPESKRRRLGNQKGSFHSQSYVRERVKFVPKRVESPHDEYDDDDGACIPLLHYENYPVRPRLPWISKAGLQLSSKREKIRVVFIRNLKTVEIHPSSPVCKKGFTSKLSSFYFTLSIKLFSVFFELDGRTEHGGTPTPPLALINYAINYHLQPQLRVIPCTMRKCPWPLSYCTISCSYLTVGKPPSIFDHAFILWIWTNLRIQSSELYFIQAGQCVECLVRIALASTYLWMRS